MKILQLSLLTLLLNTGLYSMAPNFMHQNSSSNSQTNNQECSCSCRTCVQNTNTLFEDCERCCCLPIWLYTVFNHFFHERVSIDSLYSQPSAENSNQNNNPNADR